MNEKLKLRLKKLKKELKEKLLSKKFLIIISVVVAILVVFVLLRSFTDIFGLVYIFLNPCEVDDDCINVMCFVDDGGMLAINKDYLSLWEFFNGPVDIPERTAGSHTTKCRQNKCVAPLGGAYPVVTTPEDDV